MVVKPHVDKDTSKDKRLYEMIVLLQTYTEAKEIHVGPWFMEVFWFLHWKGNRYESAWTST